MLDKVGHLEAEVVEVNMCMPTEFSDVRRLETWRAISWETRQPISLVEATCFHSSVGHDRLPLAADLIVTPTVDDNPARCSL